MLLLPNAHINTLTNEGALKILRDDSGKHFDPELVEILVNNMDEVVRIQEQNQAVETLFHLPFK